VVGAMSEYSTFRVPVTGGALAGGAWGPADAPTTLVAIHGITASHLEWPLIAERLPETRVLAPDLRGRGRSNELPPPWAMADHADDVARMMDAFGVESAVIAGHSMGGFVAGWFAARHPDRTRALVLVDGGLPLPFRIPEGVPPEDVPALLLGPAGDRLSRVYPSREEYARFWRAHPAFVDGWNDAVAAYVDYDLDEVEGGFRPSSRLAAIATNIVQQDGSGGYREALASIDVPSLFLRAPRGLLDEVPGLYPDGVLEASADLLPGLRIVDVPGVNHYGIVMADAGADVVAARLREVIAGAYAAPAATKDGK